MSSVSAADAEPTTEIPPRRPQRVVRYRSPPPPPRAGDDRDDTDEGGNSARGKEDDQPQKAEVLDAKISSKRFSIGRRRSHGRPTWVESEPEGSDSPQLGPDDSASMAPRRRRVRTPSSRKTPNFQRTALRATQPASSQRGSFPSLQEPETRNPFLRLPTTSSSPRGPQTAQSPWPPTEPSPAVPSGPLPYPGGWANTGASPSHLSDGGFGRHGALAPTPGWPPFGAAGSAGGDIRWPLVSRWNPGRPVHLCRTIHLKRDHSALEDSYTQPGVPPATSTNGVRKPDIRWTESALAWLQPSTKFTGDGSAALVLVKTVDHYTDDEGVSQITLRYDKASPKPEGEEFEIVWL
jgi:hypothetical protein